VSHLWSEKNPVPGQNKRASDRQPLAAAARLTWKDQRGTTRFASVVTRNVSEFGVYVECHSAVSIPLYRLVQFQLEHSAQHPDHVPPALRAGRVLSAVYRIAQPTPSGGRQGFALRLMVDPKRQPVEMPARATA
jgi:hypothetical protein